MTERYGKGRCPSCRAPIQWDTAKPQHHRCAVCGTRYLITETETTAASVSSLDQKLAIAERWADRYSHGFNHGVRQSLRRGHPYEVYGEWNENLKGYRFLHKHRTFLPDPINLNSKLAKLHERIDELYWHAVAGRLEGLHYNDFWVGCALLAYRPHRLDRHDEVARGEFRIFRGMNTKVESDSRANCAEVAATAAMRATDFSQVVGIVVVGQLRAEDVTKTLHPCNECQRMFAHTSLYHPWTRIITAFPPSTDEENSGLYMRTWEVRSLRQLLRVHQAPFSCVET